MTSVRTAIMTLAGLEERERFPDLGMDVFGYAEHWRERDPDGFRKFLTEVTPAELAEAMNDW